MEKKYKQFFIFVLLILIFIVAINLVPFIFKQEKFDNSVLDVSYSPSSVVTISNSLTLPDQSGKSINLENYLNGTTGYLEFEIESKVKDLVNYEVYLTEYGENNIISDRYVKLYLTDESNEAIDYFDKGSIVSYYDLRLARKNLDGKLIYTGSIKNKGKKKFILRMWVADTYGYTTESKTFSVKLNVNVL